MKYFKVILVLFLFLSCKNNKVSQPEKPDNLLSEKEMVDIIYDMSIVSAAKGVNKKLLEREGIEPESYVYMLHNIDSVQFAESSNYYTYDLKVYERIFAKVKKRLQNDKVKFDTLVKQEKRRNDSISKTRKETRKAKTEKEMFISDKRLNEDKFKSKDLPKRIDTSQISTRQ
jgi:hypothetical protein